MSPVHHILELRDGVLAPAGWSHVGEAARRLQSTESTLIGEEGAGQGGRQIHQSGRWGESMCENMNIAIV